MPALVVKQVDEKKKAPQRPAGRIKVNNVKQAEEVVADEKTPSRDNTTNVSEKVSLSLPPIEN